MQKLKEKVAAEPAGTFEGATTTAPEGASIEEVHAGMRPAQPSTSSAAAGPSTAAASNAEAESSHYAAGGSLAKALKEEEEAKKRAPAPVAEGSSK